MPNLLQLRLDTEWSITYNSMAWTRDLKTHYGGQLKHQACRITELQWTVASTPVPWRALLNARTRYAWTWLDVLLNT